MSQREAGCWRPNSTILDQPLLLQHSSISEPSTLENFRHDTIELANDLATYTIRIIRLESAVDTIINHEILKSINDIQTLLNSTRISSNTCSSSYTPCLDRLIAFYSSSSSPTNLPFWSTRFFQKSKNIYTHLRPTLFPSLTPTELLSKKLLSMIASVTASHEIYIALANVREAYSETSPKITKLIRDYERQESIPIEILKRFLPMSNLLKYIRDGSTTKLRTEISIQEEEEEEERIKVSLTNWWGMYLEQVIFTKILKELEKIGKEIEEIQESRKWIEGRTWSKVLAWEGWVKGLEG